MAFIRFTFKPDEPEEFEKTVVIGGKKHTSAEWPTMGKPFRRKPLLGAKQRETRPAERKFILDWAEELGFSDNPFRDELLYPINRFIGGYGKERDKINLFVINDHKVGIICAKEGCGKSILLRWLNEQLSQYPKRLVVLLLGKTTFTQPQGLLQHVQQHTLTWWDKFRKHHKITDYTKNVEMVERKLRNKKVVILGDNVSTISKDNLLFLNTLFSKANVQLVVTCDEESKKELSKQLRFADKLNIHLTGLQFDEARRLVRKRITYFGGTGIEPFDDKRLKLLWEKANENPRRLLQLCQQATIELAVRRKKVRKEARKIKKEHLEAPTIGLEKTKRADDYNIEVIDHSVDMVNVDDPKKEDADYRIKSS